MLIIFEYTGRTVIKPRELADWRHHFKKCGDILEDGSLQLKDKYKNMMAVLYSSLEASRVLTINSNTKFNKILILTL